MIDRQRATSYGITAASAATVALVLWLKPWATADITQPPKPAPVAGHRVDLVFAVDTTGSMGGLIEGAKRTVWSIASHVKEIDPQADLHVGLVAYRDVGDDYVTRDFSLTGDLDSVFAELSSYSAGGGGDTPEDVDAALYDAVHKMQWREGAKKIVFLVGDAPPATRGDVPAFDVTAHEAANMQITINTIRCGQDGETAQAWQRIASLGRGEFSTISQDGGVQQIATPYDDKLAKLSARIDESTVIYGDEGAHRAYEGKMAVAASAPAPAAADRAAYYGASGSASRDEADIVGGVASGAIDVDKLDDGKLPAKYRGMAKGAIKAELEKTAKDREEAQKELQELAKQRAEYLKKNATGTDGFDAKVKATVEHELK